MPFHRASSFLPQQMRLPIKEPLLVSMPFHRASSFLQKCRFYHYYKIFWCQCPFIGLPHFYRPSFAIEREISIVSMPFHRASSFLPNLMGLKSRLSDQGVSMPFHRASSFLRKNFGTCYIFLYWVSMPFHRASSFLHRRTLRLRHWRSLGCQCPFIGLPHFYKNATEIMVNNIATCQCPFIGLPHFYKGVTMIKIIINIMCQCPFIGLPHFYGKQRKQN